MPRLPRSIPVVMFHGVAPDRPDRPPQMDHWLEPAIFERYCQVLRRHRFETFFLDDLRDILHGRRPVSKRAVVLTFDDGYLDFWLYVFPLLKKYEIKATAFVTTDFIDDESPPTSARGLSVRLCFLGRAAGDGGLRTRRRPEPRRDPHLVSDRTEASRRASARAALEDLSAPLVEPVSRAKTAVVLRGPPRGPAVGRVHPRARDIAHGSPLPSRSGSRGADGGVRRVIRRRRLLRGGVLVGAVPGALRSGRRGVFRRTGRLRDRRGSAGTDPRRVGRQSGDPGPSPQQGGPVLLCSQRFTRRRGPCAGFASWLRRGLDSAPVRAPPKRARRTTRAGSPASPRVDVRASAIARSGCAVLPRSPGGRARVFRRSSSPGSISGFAAGRVV